MDNLDQIEEKLKAKKAEDEKSRHKVSGRSVFNLKKIIQDKALQSEKSTHDQEDETQSTKR